MFLQARSIIQLYAEELSEMNELEKKHNNFTGNRNSEEELLDLSLSQLHIKNVRKSANQTANKTKQNTLEDLCQRNQLCTKLHSKKQCKKIGKQTYVTRS